MCVLSGNHANYLELLKIIFLLYKRVMHIYIAIVNVKKGSIKVFLEL